MFNNFAIEKQYECCNVVLEAEPGRGVLAIGDFNSATDPNILNSHSIKTVITAATGLEHLQIPSFVRHIVYPLQDTKSQNIKFYFDENYRNIETCLKEGGVLVHCAAGVSRSATLIIAYLMRRNKMGFKEAIELLKTKRQGVCPNLGFEMQLKKYEREIAIEGKEQEKVVKNYISKKIAENNPINKPHTPYLFEFNPLLHIHKKKGEVKKGSMRHTGYSQPRSKHLFNGIETQLFVNGVSAKRPSSEVRSEESDITKGRKHMFMATLGPMRIIKTRQLQL